MLLILCSMRVIAAERWVEYDGDPFIEPVKIRSTYYIDAGTTASGCQTTAGIIATCLEWMRPEYTFELYAVDEQGNIAEHIGSYKSKDTGYGINTHEGESKILKGKPLGTIERGLSIDVFCETEEDIQFWKKHDYVYMQIVTDSDNVLDSSCSSIEGNTNGNY